ncbi:hypothetical protein LX15_004984 [Streptoalloteichus tenebrarius]|uniref:Transposase n=1 Tax=Streptoalloteichus tenebrarius (strain ATCC 17920 / DSM 40477 / JCM 4838 / CBS 697.72 / NBRC 16177 / NCIMB 11028 / NRRL B-12390 / A12253. 1 / ISP 5477) TaxID=1933 RepID=A0ABT1I0J5_STRSD|nr:hypothetical protein [Streptoalloteichus tenebrarius]
MVGYEVKPARPGRGRRYAGLCFVADETQAVVQQLVYAGPVAPPGPLAPSGRQDL